MSGLAGFLGFVCGCVATVLLQYFLKDGCEHEYELESETNHKERAWGEWHVVAKTKHYQCKKCFKIKSVRIGR